MWFIFFWFGLAVGVTELVADSLGSVQAKGTPAAPIITDEETMQAGLAGQRAHA